MSLSKIALLASAMLLTIPAADAFLLKARVVDSEGEPQAYTTYHVFHLPDTARSVVAGTAGEQGDITANVAGSGQYLLRLTYVGAADKSLQFSAANTTTPVDLGTITMSGSENTLSELEVTAQKPLVTKEIDRVGYDVQADVDAPTSSLSEMLRKVPMLSVDSDGTVTVNGSSNYLVYKNGRPSKSYSNNAAEIFKAIPASMIKRVEVITEPGAKYDAEGVGAIINIVTVEDANINGVMGNAGIDLSNKNLIPGANLWLTSQIGKVTFSVNGGYRNQNEREQDNESLSRYTYNNGNTTSTSNRSKAKGNMGYFAAEASWELDSLNLFTAEVNGFVYGVKGHGTGSTAMFAPDGSTLYSYNTITTTPSASYFDIDANVNYQHLMHNPGEMINASYQVSSNRNTNRSSDLYSDMVNMPVSYTGVDADNRENFIEHTFQFDWTRPFAKIHTLELGAKAIIRRNHSKDDFDYIGWQQSFDDFSHITDVAALYGQYSLRLGKWGLRAGVRYEYSHLKASYADERSGYSSNLHDVVPSAAATWQVDEANSFTFNYAARINRPGIDYLNPAVNESPTTVSMGNPELNSAMHHSLKLTYMLIKRRFNLNFSANYELSNNGISPVSYLEDNRMVSTYLNVGHRRQLSFSAFAQWSITDKISLMGNGGVSYTRYTQMGMELGRWSPYAFMRYTHRLPWKINGQLGFFMFSHGPQSVYSYNDMGRFSNFAMWNVSLSRNFLKDDRLTVRIEAFNPIGRSERRWTSLTVNGDFTGINQSMMKHMKGIRLAVSYRFGSMRGSVKKTARSISNDDIVGGSSAGSSTSGEMSM